MTSLFPPFLLGFLATSFQIFLLREFSSHFYGNEITFGLILAFWLFWGGMGSISATKIPLKKMSFPLIYYLLLFLFPLSLVGLRLERFLLNIIPGEITGMTPMILSALALTLFISFPIGILFVFNVHLQQGNVARVYLAESLGSAAGGLIVYFFLIPFLSNWQGVAMVGGFTSLAIFSFFSEKSHRYLFPLAVLFLLAFFFLDSPSQKLYWSPFHLLRSKDTPYGKIQILRLKNEISLYDNGLHVYTYPNLAASEEAVHFGLLQRNNAQKVLMVGGGAGGGLREALKYPQVRVDYVELDPEMIRLSLAFLPEEEKKIHQDRRVQIFYQDGKKFLKKVEKLYDAILLNIPEPATAQINRFYTREFFELAKKKLSPEGVLSFRLPSAENYISPALQQFLSSIAFTLKNVFPYVEIVPGDTNIFLASSSPLDIDFNFFRQKIENLNLQTAYVNPSLLLSRLHPLKKERLAQKLAEGPKRLNLDLVPISYYLSSVLWSTQFKGWDSQLLGFFSTLPSFWLLNFPLLLAVCFLIFMVAKPFKPSDYLLPLTFMGLTSIVAEIVIIIAFQTFYGYVYGQVALLLTCFMFGLFLGAWQQGKRRATSPGHFLLVQFFFLLLILGLQIYIKTQPSEFFAFLFLLAIGLCGGALFVVSNSLFLERKQNYGLGYGLDLLGSFLGALFASSILIPLAGLKSLLDYLFLLNFACFLFILIIIKKKKPKLTS